jgi:Tol biopolymer transport system component
MNGTALARASVIALAVVTLGTGAADAQYFGRNKVHHERFDFRIMKSAHFESHFYPAESVAVADAVRMAERWYARFSTLLGHEFKQRPLVFYADHPDFQQTNVIGQLIEQGIGGVTKSARNRVIMPFTGIYADNDHVLGHELVHVFQYAIADTVARAPGGRGSRGIEALPLWLIEGMAEYLSLGRTDAHTAMWLRDAVLRNDLPTIKQLTNDSRFFPYRYGEALWAYVGGRYGDAMVGQLYRASLQHGFEPAIKRVLGISHDSLSKAWHDAIRTEYMPLVDGMAHPSKVGLRLLPRERQERGMLEVSPSLSPDGRYVAFLSGRNLVSIDLFIAEVETGRVVAELTSPNADEHFGTLSFVSAAGSWSPDGRQLAYVTFANGDNEIAIFDVDRRRVVERFNIEGVGAINDAAWGPTGEIAFSGSRGGLSDIYILDPRTKDVRQLTNDRYADIQPTWSPDGQTLAFATDRGDETDFDLLTHGPMRLAMIDVAGGEILLLPAFDRAKHINPRYSPGGDELYFISDRDGFSNVYRLSLDDGTVYQVTRIATGVSGITALSPALTVAARSGRMVFSVFDDSGVLLYRLEPTGALDIPVDWNEPNERAAALLPPASPLLTSAVAAYLADPSTGLPSEPSTVRRYGGGLGIEYIGPVTAGVAFGGYGTGVGGSIQAYFSDMLRNRIVGAALYSGGDVHDLGGEAMYLSQRGRVNWLVGAGHIPYVLGANYWQVARLYVDQGTVAAQYPLSTTRRLEAGVSANRLSVGVQTWRGTGFDNRIVDRISYGEASVALVGDYSTFGFTSPIAGGRYRFEYSPVFGGLDFGALLADYRRYLFARPVTFAFRGLHYGRYGRDAEESDWLSPLFLGNTSLVRGYSYDSFDGSECTAVEDPNACPEFDRLLGSRIAVASAELRIPVLGPRQLALIPLRFLPLEIAPFVDAGVAWTSEESPSFRLTPSSIARVPVVSAGVTARVNLFGAMVLEVYYAHPFQRPEKGSHFGFQLQPGW